MSLVPLPKVPTDNLYKFLALSGVLMMVFGIYWPAHEAEEWYARVDALEASMAVFAARTSDDRRHILNIIKDRADSLPALQKNADARTYREVVVPAADKAREMMEAEVRVDAEREEADKEALARMKVEAAVIQRLGNQAVTRHHICTFLACLGSAMMSVGFFWWYFKIQVHIDRAYAAGVFGKGEGTKPDA